MKGASVNVAILNFFTRHDPFSHHAKFHLLLRPPSSFLWVFLKLLTNFVFGNFFDLSYVQNLGHCCAKQTIFRSVGLKMDEKQSVTFALFLHFFISFLHFFILPLLRYFYLILADKNDFYFLCFVMFLIFHCQDISTWCTTERARGTRPNGETEIFHNQRHFVIFSMSCFYLNRGSRDLYLFLSRAFCHFLNVNVLLWKVE